MQEALTSCPPGMRAASAVVVSANSAPSVQENMVLEEK